MSVHPCRSAEWDSEFFGVSIGRVESKRLTLDLLAEIDAWAAREKVDCLYFLCDPTCASSARLAEDAGFRLVDVRVTLDLPPDAPRPGSHPVIRAARTDDAEILANIASSAHTDSRFFFDPGFPETRCRDLYDAWIRRSMDGWADAVMVADLGDGPLGYITCHRDDQGRGSIGLIGVSDHAQGQGLGRQLVAAARSWFIAQGAESVTVVTQGRNLRAQRLYHRAGFLPCAVGLWFHRWHDRTGD